MKSKAMKASLKKRYLLLFLFAGVTSLCAVGGLLYLFILTHQTEKDSLNQAYIKAMYSKPVTYDPILMNEGASLTFAELVYEGLLRFNNTFGVEGALATSWKTSKDGKVITFTLKKGVWFHDGRILKARDVVYSLTRAVSPQSRVYKYYDMILGAKEYYTGQAKSVKGLRSPSDYVVEVELKNPFPPIIYILAGSTAKILPFGYGEEKSFFRTPVGTGPFQFLYMGEKDLTLKRFNSYHSKKPLISKMILRVMDQKSSMEGAKSGKVHDLSSWPLSGEEDVFQKGQLITVPMADTWVIGFNTRMPPFDRLEVRRAFKQSIDSEKFRKAFYPRSLPAYGYIPNGFPGHILKKPSIASMPSISEFFNIPDHESITITIPAGHEREKELTQFFEKDLTSKGWKVKTEVMDWQGLVKAYNEKSLQSFLVAMNVDYPDSEFLLNNFESTNPDNFSGIKNVAIDRLIQKARRTQNRLKRQNIYKEIAQKVNGLALTANLFHSQANYWLHPCVRGFEPNPLGLAYVDYRQVGFDKKCLKESHL